jgi:hypothetical protein
MRYERGMAVAWNLRRRTKTSRFPPSNDLKFDRFGLPSGRSFFCGLGFRVHAALLSFGAVREPACVDFVSGVDAASIARAGIG